MRPPKKAEGHKVTQEQASAIVAEVARHRDSRIEAREGYNPWPRGPLGHKHLGVALRLFPDTGRERRMFISAAREWESVFWMWQMLLEEEDKRKVGEHDYHPSLLPVP